VLLRDGIVSSCEDAVAQQLVDMLRQAGRDAEGKGGDEDDERFHAIQNARVVKPTGL
jgi:hypothetical protein